MTEVDVCVCTFRRPHIAETLTSLAAQTLPADLQMCVIVADNDETPSARDLVEVTARKLGLKLTYVHAPARNISIARNACLDTASAPLLAFIDDDELATQGWLAAMVAALDDSDAVLGPVKAIYDEGCPAWIVKADLHSAKPVWVAGKIVTGYTSNVLFRRTAPEFAGLRFRKELGRSGGEDTAFFTAAHQAGAKIAYAPEGLVTEAVPPQRATLGWLLRRRFRAGLTHGMLLREGRAKAIPKATVKAVFCLAGAIGTAFSPWRSRVWLLRGALHVGVVTQLLGGRDVEHYGAD